MHPAATIAPCPPIPIVAPRHDARLAIQSLLADSPDYSRLDPEIRTKIAGALARIGSSALEISEAAEGKIPAPARGSLAIAQSAGSESSGAAVNRIAGTARNILAAISFPRFVNELITGVFKAMNDSNQQQLTAFVDLIRNVAQSVDGFADANVGISGARSWLAEHFPGSYQVEGGDEVDMAAELEGLDPVEARQRREEIQAEQDANSRLGMRPGGQAPSEAALRTALGAPEGTPVTPADPEAMVPLARQVLGRNRQQLLATMIQMGMQRIVIESGRVNAGMRLHIDASSAAENDRSSRFDFSNTTEAGGGVKVGPWGAEARTQNTIAYVTTDRTSTTESLNASVDLDSAVELVFRTDYVPLSRLAGTGDVERIRVNTLNPEAEAQRAATEANARAEAARMRSAERAARVTSDLQPARAPDRSSLNPAEVIPGAGPIRTAGQGGQPGAHDNPVGSQPGADSQTAAASQPAPGSPPGGAAHSGRGPVTPGPAPAQPTPSTQHPPPASTGITAEPKPGR